jgi:hypothetical protein
MRRTRTTGNLARSTTTGLGARLLGRGLSGAFFLLRSFDLGLQQAKEKRDEQFESNEARET